MRRVVSERSPPCSSRSAPATERERQVEIYERSKLNSLLEGQEAVCNLPSGLAVAVASLSDAEDQISPTKQPQTPP